MVLRGEVAGGGGHQHVDCPPNQRRWLERRLGQAATMRPHVFCLSCGKVKNLHGPRAKGLGFYLSGLAALREYLERSPKYGKMTQSQGRLITKSLERLREFEDSYDSSLEIQGRIYLEAVKRVRPNLEEELVLRLLPKVRRETSRPFLGVMTGQSAG